MQNENEWVYPMVLKYRNEWGIWESIREFVQNMMDTGSNFEINREPYGISLRDYGSGLKKRHLLLGLSEKSEGSRGKFGEGSKIAFAVLKRLNYGVEVLSENLKIDVDTTEIEGETCLKLILDESPRKMTLEESDIISSFH